MRITLNSKQGSEGRSSSATATLPEAGYTLPEVMAATAILALAASLFGLFAPGLGIIRCAGQNLRATQILMQRAEGLSLFNCRQVSEPNSRCQPLFVEPHDPQAGPSRCSDVEYAGYVAAATLAPGGLTSTYAAHMRPVTVTLQWTNYIGAKPVVSKREVQARLARNGMPKYIWGTL